MKHSISVIQLKAIGMPKVSCLETKLNELKLDVSFIPKQRNTSCNIDHRVSWADIPADVLFIIFGLLGHINNHDFIDLYQCLAVCRSWRFVAKQIWRNHILPTTPWLLHKETEDYTILFNTNPYKWHKHLRLETNDNASSFSFNLDSYRMKNYASYDGWLLLGTSPIQPLLYNPVTKIILQLPPLPTDLRLHSHMKFVSSRSTPTDPNCIICLKFSTKRDFFCYYGTALAFCRPVSSSSWVILNEPVEDIVFCGGQFYAIATSGALFVYNDSIINGNTVPNTSWTWTKMKIGCEICGINSRSMLDFHCFFFYLVESKTGDLLLIKRIFERKCCTTKSFCIFKLKYWSDTIYGHYNYYWDEISSLPEKEALLLGWNDCISISIDEHNTYKSDCIYFYDEDIRGKLTAYGMYDLRRHSILRKSNRSYIYYCRFFNPSKLSNV